ncbi:ABC transporter ATP-binding protein [Candidatus Poribacteria bacterium]|nr:ABC transporter ATP-binding protein [Candidatus Poribacteria bacterium]
MIRVQELCKSFQRKPILTELTFQLDGGERLALLGVNGSGKTLLLKILATLIQPTSGSVEIAGYDSVADVHAVRPLIGYVPETFDGYPNLSVGEYLHFFAAAYKLERTQRSAGIQNVLELMDLIALRDQKIQYLSPGQKRRLCLAKTFLHDPLVWLLDAPISALDPRGQLEMGALIKELGAMGKTVVLATNHLADVTAACNRVGILDQGRFAVYGEVADISRQIENTHRLDIEVVEGIHVAQAILEKRSDLRSLEIVDRRIQLESQMADSEIASLLKDLIQAGVTIVSFHKNERWLENLFLDITSAAAAGEGHPRR